MVAEQLLRVTKGHRVLRRFVVIVVTLAACAGVVLGTMRGFSPASNHVEWRLFDVPPHTALSDIADKLQKNGIIRSRVCFLISARLSGESSHMQAGEYRLSPSMKLVDIVGTLSKGQVVTSWVIIPPGSTLLRIESILVRQGLARGNRFEAALRQEARRYHSHLGLTLPSLEGYLYPDNYKIPKDMAEPAIVRMMVERFQQAVLVDMKEEIHNSTSGLGVPEDIILASLVEKEARHDEERAHIAGVLLNRLRNGRRLECDATIEYVLPQHKSHLTHQDMLINSPYNTYKHRGLPPTAICSPGKASILGALNPVTTHDLYYVARPDGYHIFSQSLAEHDRAIAKIRQMNEKSQ